MPTLAAMLRPALVLAGSLLIGCAGMARVSAESLSVARDALPTQLVPGNSVTVLRNGEVFDALEAELVRAQTSIHIILFIWRPGEPSDRITRALVERAKAGVRCRVIVDPFWSVGFEEQIQPELEAAGCEVHVFKPLQEVRVPAELVERQHRKLIVIDGKVGVTGGFGLWRSWLGDGVGDDEWRDAAVLFRGPVVGQAQGVFARDWRELTGRGLEEESFPPLEFVGTTKAMFVGSDAATKDLSNAQRVHHWLIHEAKERVWISNSYFVPSEALSGLLKEKAGEGVDVTVIAPGDRHDMPIVLAAQRSTYKPLREGGVRIWEYQASMMHSKTVVVDQRYSVIGSINLDPMSLRQARECALVVDDPAIAAELAADFELDRARSIPIRNPPARTRQAIAWLVMWLLGSI